MGHSRRSSSFGLLPRVAVTLAAALLLLFGCAVDSGFAAGIPSPPTKSGGAPPKKAAAVSRSGSSRGVSQRHSGGGIVSQLLGGLGLPGPFGLDPDDDDNDDDENEEDKDTRHPTYFTFCNLIPGDASAVARLVRDRSHYTPALLYQQCITQGMTPELRDQILEVYHAPGSIATDQRQITRTYQFNPVNGSENLLLLTRDPAHGLWELTIPTPAYQTGVAEPPSGDPPLIDVVLFNSATETEEVAWGARRSEDNGDSWTPWTPVPGAQAMGFKEYQIVGLHRNSSARQLIEFRIEGFLLPEFRLNVTDVAEQVRAAYASPPDRNGTTVPPTYPSVRVLVALTGQAVGVGMRRYTDTESMEARMPVGVVDSMGSSKGRVDTPGVNGGGVGSVNDGDSVDGVNAVDREENHVVQGDDENAAADTHSDPESSPPGALLQSSRRRRRSFPLQIAGYYTTSPGAARFAAVSPASAWLVLVAIGVTAAVLLLDAVGTGAGMRRPF